MFWRRNRPNEAQWRKFRLTILDRDSWVCVLCSKNGRLEVDHINGHAAGMFEASNCRTLCRDCHLAVTREQNMRHTPERDEWRAYIANVYNGGEV